MKTTKQVATITLIILLGLIAYGLFRTGKPMTASQVAPGGELNWRFMGLRLIRVLSMTPGGWRKCPQLPMNCRWHRRPYASVIARWTWRSPRECGRPKKIRRP